MKIIERWKKSLYRKAVKHRLIAPQVIVLMDGGEFVLRCTNICWVEFLKMEDIKCSMICLSMKSGEQI